MLRHSTELIQQSALLNGAARRSITSTQDVITRSRELLSEWPVSGTPILDQRVRVAPKRSTQDVEPVGEPAPGKTAAAEEMFLKRVVEQNLTGQIVQLDGCHFVDCRIDDCLLQYNGGPVVLESTHFTACRFSFAAEAAMTVAMLECFGLLERQQTHSAGSRGSGSKAARPN